MNKQHFVFGEALRATTRRHFFRQCGVGLGGVALTSLLNEKLLAAQPSALRPAPAGRSAMLDSLAPKVPHFAATAKRVIYIHMAGSPSHLDLFDYKPKLIELNGKPCPESIYKKERFAFIKGVPKMLGTPHKFAKHGQSGAELSTMLPHLAEVADDICIVKSMFTDQFNHAPAQLFLHTGSPRLGRPGMGSWVTYGLGSESQNLPGFVVLTSGGKTPDGGASLWGSGFLPTVYQGVQCRSSGDPVLYVSNPPGMSSEVRRDSLDTLRELNEMQLKEFGDPETLTRISQYELAYRMQTTVPELMEIDKEPKTVHEMYGTEPGKTSFANNCLLARRLIERGVRFVQIYHWGWDQHGNSKDNDLFDGLGKQCKDTDKATAALIKDLKQRGLLDDTLV
ncbi:MAG TPA: DUF1501 domain-containing protein, partial [Verrucomicrobiae bacterium]